MEEEETINMSKKSNNKNTYNKRCGWILGNVGHFFSLFSFMVVSGLLVDQIQVG